MIPWLLVLVAFAETPPPDTCAYVGLGDVTGLAAPAVIVLGERKGMTPDLTRAEKIASKLSRSAKVTVALEALDREKQPVLDRYANGELVPTDIPDLVGWKDFWGFPWAPYERLVTLAVLGVDVLGVGLPLSGKPSDAQLPIPPGYIHILADTMGESPVPVELESSFVQTVAWRDHAIAKHAITGWDGTGYLVIVADRLHVQGGKGIGWQAQQLTQAPVHSFLLADAGSRCYAGDRIIRGLFQ